MLTVRPFDFTEVDYEAWVAIANTVWTESPTTVGSLKQRIETRDPNYLYQLLMLVDPNLFAEGWYVALDAGRYMGMTQLFKRNRRVEDLQAGFSAVRRSHRRRGIVTALKTLSIEAARQHGARTIKTGNEENNPMYQINLRLGFRPEPASLAFKKRIE